MARGSLVTPVWRPNTNVVSITASASAKPLSGSPAVWTRSKQRLSPIDGWITGVFASSAVSGSVTAAATPRNPPHQLAAVLGLGARARDHGADRLAGPAGAVDRDGVLRRRLEALEMRQHADPGRDDLGQFRAGDHGDDAGGFLRRAVSMDLDLACACGERTNATCAMRGSTTSLTYCARPCIRRARFGRGTERPM